MTHRFCLSFVYCGIFPLAMRLPHSVHVLGYFLDDGIEIKLSCFSFASGSDDERSCNTDEKREELGSN